MQAASEEHGVALMEAFMYRFHPRTRRVLERVRLGELGEVRMIHSAFTFRITRPDNIRLRPDLGGGALRDVGCYCVNVSRALAGSEPVEVQAWASWTPGGVDSEMAGSLRFGGGVVAQFECALGMERREAYDVAGTEGWFHVPQAFLPGSGGVSFTEHRGRDGESRHDVEGADEYRLMVEHFADAVLCGTPLLLGAGDSAATLAVIEALYRSARAGGAPVRVAP